MTARLVVFVDKDLPWLRIENESIVERGNHFVADETDDAPVVLVAPAGDVQLHWADLPALAPAQARAAARLIVAEHSLIASNDLFVACADNDVAGQPRVVAMANRSIVQGWVAAFDPDVILPSPLLLEQPEEGFTRAHLETETVLRGAQYGFAEDDVVSPMIIGATPVSTLTDHELDTTIIAATGQPAINLRQGEFARKRVWAIDKKWLRTVAVLAASIIALALIIPVVQIVRLSWSTATLEQTSASLAQTALGETVAPEAAVAALDARLTSLRGGGAGFSAIAGAVTQSVEATANTELTAMAFGPDGTLRITVRAAGTAEIDAIQVRMRALGLLVTAGNVNPSQGQPLIELQVRGR